MSPTKLSVVVKYLNILAKPFFHEYIYIIYTGRKNKSINYDDLHNTIYIRVYYIIETL